MKCHNEQYSHSNCYGFMALNLKKWKNRWCVAKSKRMLRIGTRAICTRSISCAHRIGMECMEKNSGKKVKSIIAKFKSSRAQKQFYNARQKSFKDGQKKPGYKSFLSRLL